MQEITFETERLILRNWNDKDKIPFATMNKDIKVMEYFPHLLTDEESNKMIDRIIRTINEKRYGLWAAELKEDGSFIGFIGLNYTDFQSEFTPCIEIGWRLSKEFWGNGYATEGAKRCIEYGFIDLGIEIIYSFTSIGNEKSENVMKRLGMKKVGEFNHPRIEQTSKLCRHILYRMTNKEYMEEVKRET